MVPATHLPNQLAASWWFQLMTPHVDHQFNGMGNWQKWSFHQSITCGWQCHHHRLFVQWQVMCAITAARFVLFTAWKINQSGSEEFEIMRFDLDGICWEAARLDFTDYRKLHGFRLRISQAKQSIESSILWLLCPFKCPYNPNNILKICKFPMINIPISSTEYPHMYVCFAPSAAALGNSKGTYNGQHNSQVDGLGRPQRCNLFHELVIIILIYNMIVECVWNWSLPISF